MRLMRAIYSIVAISAVSIFGAATANAADVLGVSGFIPVYINMSGGEYSMAGASVYSGGVFLLGGGYQISDGVLNASAALPETLSDAHAWPNPCNARKGCSQVKFSKITQNAEFKIYTVSGELVWEYGKNSPEETMAWDLRNMSGSEVASGLYIYYVKTGNSSKKGKLIIIR